MRPANKRRKAMSTGARKVTGGPARAVSRGGRRGFNNIARPKSRSKRY